MTGGVYLSTGQSREQIEKEKAEREAFEASIVAFSVSVRDARGAGDAAEKLVYFMDDIACALELVDTTLRRGCDVEDFAGIQAMCRVMHMSIRSEIDQLSPALRFVADELLLTVKAAETKGDAP